MTGFFNILISVGGVLTGFAGVLWFFAGIAESLMREEIKNGYVSWLKTSSFDKPFRDWCYSFTYLYDTAFSINSSPYRLSLPSPIRVGLLAAVSLAFALLFLGYGKEAFESIFELFSENGLFQRYPAFARTIIVDLATMIFLTLVISFAAIYLSVLKTRFFLEIFNDGASPLKRAFYMLLDVVLSILLFLIVLQIISVYRSVSQSFYVDDISRQYINVPKVPKDLSLVDKISDIYWDFLLPVCLTILGPIAWTVMFVFGAFAAKILIHLETLRKLTIKIFNLEAHPLQVTAVCIVGLWTLLFWIPVAAYAVTQHYAAVEPIAD